jgi:hypothetical protein
MKSEKKSPPRPSERGRAKALRCRTSIGHAFAELNEETEKM